jgi:diguanylate cyclase (GGDEF)-like protein
MIKDGDLGPMTGLVLALTGLFITYLLNKYLGRIDEINARLEEMVKDRTHQLEMANKELKELTLHDPLTQLYNRRCVCEFIADLTDSFIKQKKAMEFTPQKRYSNLDDEVIGLYLIDIDFFKNVNDTYGHTAGDNVLTKIAETIKSLVRSDDFIIRWGGEEFLIILNRAKVEHLKTFSKRILELIRATPFELSGNETIYKTCSIGCISLPFGPGKMDLLTLEQGINLADVAMYQAKERGRNRAIHIGCQNRPDFAEKDLKTYLLALTKESDIDENILSIEEVL